MIFNSWQFVFVFLPVTLGIFYGLASWRMTFAKYWLILASLCFYAYWKVEYLVLLLGSIGFNYCISHWINFQAKDRQRYPLLIFGVVANLLLLGYFKYTNFFLSVLQAAGAPVHGPLAIVLPLAISFFTFTQIAYLVDVFRDKTLRYAFTDYVFFVVFFPHLIAGPIVRHGEIIPQLPDWSKRLGLQHLAVGVTMFTLGLCKKCLLADRLMPDVESVYNAAQQGLFVGTKDAWLGTLAFALQIYFDFSAYSDMALGLACMFGLKFPVNFDSPYQAKNIIDFWARWHMTLTRFLREYVYFTLGGNRCSPWRAKGNIFATMLLSGMWHGAGWAFLIWGGLHGSFLMIAHLCKDWGRRFRWPDGWLTRMVGWGLTMLAVVWAWVWFRAGQVGPAWHLTTSMMGLSTVKAHGSLVTAALPIKLLILYGVVFFLPNTQQLLRQYEPALELVPTVSSFRLQINFATALILGFLFFLVTRDFFVTRSTLFIYFKF